MSSRTIPKGCFGSAVAFSLYATTCAACDLRGACRKLVAEREPKIMKLLKADIDRRMEEAPEDETTQRVIEAAKTVGRAFLARRK